MSIFKAVISLNFHKSHLTIMAVDEKDVELLDKKRRNKEPLWIVKKMVSRPKLAFGM